MQAKVKTKGASQTLVISANRLLDGAVVWLAADGRWAETLAEAEVFVGTAVTTGLATAAQAEARQLVVGAYELEVTPTGTGVVPLRARERFRAAGPSIAVPAAA